MLKAYRAWRQRRKDRQAELDEAKALLKWARNTELRLRSNSIISIGEKVDRPILVRITIDQLHHVHIYGGSGRVGNRFTFGTFSGEFELYFANKHDWTTYDR